MLVFLLPVAEGGTKKGTRRGQRESVIVPRERDTIIRPELEKGVMTFKCRGGAKGGKAYGLRQ